MKAFDPNYKLLDEMYQDDYYPAFLVDKVKDELQKVIDLLESGETDTEVVQEKLDERWLFALAKDPEGKKPAVTWQTYNRGGVLYGSYDEMLISLLPRKVENPELRRALRDYFRIRSEKVSVEESITVYKDAAERFGGE